MNVRALRRAVKRARKEVEARNVFDMGSWAAKLYTSNRQRQQGEPCGTACCLAGFSIPTRRMQKLLNTGRSTEIEFEAMDALGIDSDQASRLFHTGGWPWPFYDAYYTAYRQARKSRVCTQKRVKAELAKVQALHDRVEHFIATEGAE
jgi:hypothetical protein